MRRGKNIGYNKNMDVMRNVINNNSGIYLKYDYLMYPVNLCIAPKVKVENNLFFSKNGYHVSLLCLEGVTKLEQTKIFKFAEKYTLKLGTITNTYRLVSEKGQQSIIVNVRFVGLKKLIMAINKRFETDFEYPPTHITLFTLKGQTGVGVNTLRKYSEVSQEIGTDDSRRLRRSFKLI
jgi:hypothetical protein